MSPRANFRSTVVSVGTHLVGLASAPALFVALAPLTVPVPAEAVGAPVAILEPAARERARSSRDRTAAPRAPPPRATSTST